MADEFTFTDIVPSKKEEEELTFSDIAPSIKEDEFTFADIATETKSQQPQGLYGIGAFPGYEQTPVKPEPTRQPLAPIPYLESYPAGLIDIGREASKRTLPPLHWYIEKTMEDLPSGYKKELEKHKIAKTVGKGFGIAGAYASLMQIGQAAGLFKLFPKISGTLTGLGIPEKLAIFLAAGVPTSAIFGAEKTLNNLSEVMTDKKDPNIQTLLWEPTKSAAFGFALGGLPPIAGGPKMAAAIGGGLYGTRTAAPYIEKMWKGEKPEWKKLAMDMAISVPIGMFVSYYGYEKNAEAYMQATKNYMVEKNADFIQANAGTIKENPESFIFATKYKGQTVNWGFQPEVQKIIQSGQADLTNRKTALSLARKVVDHFFAHPSPQINADFSNMSNIIKNSPAMIEGMTKDITDGISPTAAFIKNSADVISTDIPKYVDDAQIAKQFADQIMSNEKKINNIDWNKVVPSYKKDITPGYQQLIDTTKALWESNNALIDKYDKAKIFVKGEEREQFEARVEELKTQNIEIKDRLKEYGFTPASPKQKSLARKLARRANLTDKEFLDLKRELTATDSMTIMSRKQADAIINALSFKPKGKTIPVANEPIFKKPTLAQWPTSKHTYAKVLGLGPMMEDMFIAEINRSLEAEQITKFANDITKNLNKQASFGDRLASMVKAKPTQPVKWMSELLDTYSKADDIPNIDPKNAETFTKIRNLTDDLLARENSVREIMGKNPIESVKAYIPHVFDQVTKSILNQLGTISIETDPLMKLKDLDVPDDMKDWLRPRMPRKPFNPTEFKRQTGEEIKKYWSKDLNKLIRWLGHYATREIYLSEPLEIFKGQLEHYADLGILPEETKDWAEAVVKHDIFKQPGNFEKAINNTFEPLTDLINHVLHPINRHLSDPISQISKTTRKLVIASALMGRPKMPIRNSLQRGLLLNLYPAKHFIKAQLGLNKITPEIKKQLRDTWMYRTSKHFEDAPDIGNKIIQWGMTPYRFSHAGLWPGKIPLSNIDVAMATGWLAGEELRTSPRYIKWAEQKAIKEGKPKDFYKRTPQDSIEEAIRAAEYTQFVYHTAFMPQYFRGQLGRFFGSLTSWGNFFTFTHNRELLHVLGKGESLNGKPYPPYYRARSILGYATFLAILEGLKQTSGLDYTRFYLGAPGMILNPMARFSLGAILYTTSKSNYDRNYGKYLMKSSAKMFTGFGLAGEEWRKWMTGEISTKEFFTFTDKRKSSLGKLF